jgi:hypothetical protein
VTGPRWKRVRASRHGVRLASSPLCTVGLVVMTPGFHPGEDEFDSCTVYAWCVSSVEERLVLSQEVRGSNPLRTTRLTSVVMPPTEMAPYMKARRAERRRILRRILGGVCVDCGTSEHLEFDHADPSRKNFTIASHLDGDWDVLVGEVMKCELRCGPHHRERSKQLGHFGIRGKSNGVWVEALHGTSKKYGLGCKCSECREWKRKYRIHLVDSRGNPR